MPACILVLLGFVVLTLSLPVYSDLSEESDEEALFGLYGDDEFISIATGIRQPIAKAPAVATVITADDIRAMGATDLDEVLETVPGLHVSRDPFGYQPAYIFRGIYSKFNPQVLVLINSIPITNLFHGDRGLIWGGMQVNAISRIEVIRGPGSAVYGADAFAGVINITTKNHDDIDGAKAGIRKGSFGQTDAWYLTSTEAGKAKISFALEYHKTDGQDQVIDADIQTGLDSLMGTNASLAPGSVNLSRKNLDLRFDLMYESWKFRAGLQRRADFGNGAGVAEALDPSNRYLSERWNTDVTYSNDNISEDWGLSAQISYLDTSQEVEEQLNVFPAGTNVPPIPGLGFEPGLYPDGVIGNPEVFERHMRADISTTFSGVERHIFRMGVGYYHGDIYKVKETKNFGSDPADTDPSDGIDFLPPGSPVIDVTDTPYVFLPEKARYNRHAFIQDIWDFAADWELTAGIRYDHFSDFGDTVNPRAAMVWSASHDLTVKMLYGEAFRSPSFTQLFAINNPSVLGNSELEPETIKSTELAFDYRYSHQVRFGLNIFHYEWDEIIQFVADSGGASTKTAQNSGKQNGNGIELESSWDVNSALTLNASYSYQDSEDKKSSEQSPQTPEKQFYVSALWHVSPYVQIHSQLNWVMDRARDVNDTREAINDYRAIDLTVRKKLNGSPWSYAASIKNLTDEDIREPSPWAFPAAAIPNDLPLAGRSFLAELEYHF